MKMENAVIRINVRRLNFPLDTMHARLGMEYIARFIDCPDDVTGIKVRVFKPDINSFFDMPCHRCTDGVVCRIHGACFQVVGTSRYEIHALASDGHPCALGQGLVDVGPYSSASNPVQPGEPFVVTQIMDDTGASHNIKAVEDEDGNWTTILEA